jgi:hypothetical protein
MEPPSNVCNLSCSTKILVQNTIIDKTKLWLAEKKQNQWKINSQAK